MISHSNYEENKQRAITRNECVIKVQIADAGKTEQLMKFAFFSFASWKNVVGNLITLK